MAEASYRLYVRSAPYREWGEFFVCEAKPRLRGGHLQYAASFTALTSYGVFGHFWSHMGEPWVEFASGIDQGYLLGKIGHKTVNDKKIIEGVRRAILHARRQQDASKDEAREAWDELDELRGEYSGDVLCHEIYHNSMAINKVIGDYAEITTQDWDVSCLKFVELLWPEFVKALQARAAAQQRTTRAHHHRARRASKRGA
jgi:hypothetical protein